MSILRKAENNHITFCWAFSVNDNRWYVDISQFVEQTGKRLPDVNINTLDKHTKQ